MKIIRPYLRFHYQGIQAKSSKILSHHHHPSFHKIVFTRIEKSRKILNRTPSKQGTGTGRNNPKIKIIRTWMISSFITELPYRVSQGSPLGLGRITERDQGPGTCKGTRKDKDHKILSKAHQRRIQAGS